MSSLKRYYYSVFAFIFGLLATPLAHATPDLKTDLLSVVNQYLGLSGDGGVVLITGVVAMVSMGVAIALYRVVSRLF